MKYQYNSRRKRLSKLLLALLIIGLLIAGGVFFARKYYFDSLTPVSQSQKSVNVVIPAGSSLGDVAKILKDSNLIRNEWVFRQYVRNQQLQDKIQAGTYAIRPSQDVQQIVVILTEGKISSKLVTITPGQRIDQVEQTLINSGFDPEATAKALDPKTYPKHPALVDKPAKASLEGYLYPESFQRTAETTPSEIIEASLDEMAKVLTPEMRQSFSKKGLTTHQAIILASMAEKEVDSLEDRRKVVQVFLSRLDQDKKLESDATAIYGAILDGAEPSVTYKSSYNTYVHPGLPPGPISNTSKEALLAVASPAKTDWLYFVSGDDGKTYFSKTLEEHEKLTELHCKQKCSSN